MNTPLGSWKELRPAEKFYVVVAAGWLCAWVFFVYAHIRYWLGP